MNIPAQSIEVDDLSFGQKKILCHREGTPDRWTYRMKLGRETIWLEPVEFAILRFLAKRPYHAYSRQQIAVGVTSDRQPVDAESIDSHVASLRHKLGFFADYIQSVPYTGFRFKE